MGFKDEPADGTAWRRNTDKARTKEPDLISADDLEAEAIPDFEADLSSAGVIATSDTSEIDALFPGEAWDGDPVEPLFALIDALRMVMEDAAD